MFYQLLCPVQLQITSRSMPSDQAGELGADSLGVLDKGAPLGALSQVYWRKAGAVAQQVADLILVDLYEADLQAPRSTASHHCAQCKRAGNLSLSPTHQTNTERL